MNATARKRRLVFDCCNGTREMRWLKRDRSREERIRYEFTWQHRAARWWEMSFMELVWGAHLDSTAGGPLPPALSPSAGERENRRPGKSRPRASFSPAEAEKAGVRG